MHTIIGKYKEIIILKGIEEIYNIILPVKIITGVWQKGLFWKKVTVHI